MTHPARNFGRLLRTVAQLEPAQVAHRLRLQAQRRVVGRHPERFAERWQVTAIGAPGLPRAFQAIDATHLAGRWDPAELARGSFDLLNERRHLGEPVAWDPPGATQLWLFHLHYWEWAWSLAVAPDRDAARTTFAGHWASWRHANSFGRWNAWAPYPASLRAWVLVNVHQDLAAGTDLDAPLTADIGLHAGFLEHNLELDVGGNHLIKNIKGLLGCAVFLHDPGLVALALRQLDRELAVQVLPDGGHYELSPSYHCQVLADLLDMARLLASSGRPAVPALDGAIERMRTWLGHLILPDGGLPLFNDCEPVEPGLLGLLGPGPGPTGPLTVLPDSGYVVARSGPFHLVADVGQPGPASPPGHIHADCLGFALSVDGERAVVDTGTSEYGSGPRRQYERSTAAHNTIEVDGTDQTEVFGAFRAGRRAHATLERAEVLADGTITVTASHDGYRHLPGRPHHRRTWTVTLTGVDIDDRIDGSGRHHLAARLHLPDARPHRTGEPAGGTTRGPDRSAAPGRISVTHDGPPPPGAPTVSREACQLAAGFGLLEPGTTITCAFDASLPTHLRTHIGLAREPLLNAGRDAKGHRPN